MGVPSRCVDKVQWAQWHACAITSHLAARLTTSSLPRSLSRLVRICERGVVEVRVRKRKSSLSPWRRCYGRSFFWLFLLFFAPICCLQQLIGNSIYLLQFVFCLFCVLIWNYAPLLPSPGNTLKHQIRKESFAWKHSFIS